MEPIERKVSADTSLSSKAHSFDTITSENTPKKIILDTNFVLNFTHRFVKHPKSGSVADCTNFAKSLVHAGSDIFIPQIVVNELCCQVYLNVLDDYKKRSGSSKTKLVLYDEKPAWIQSGHTTIMNAIKNLDIISTNKSMKEAGAVIRDRATKLMRRHHMLPSDAFIGSATIINEIYNIATLDVYFAQCMVKEPHVNVYLPDRLYQKYFTK